MATAARAGARPAAAGEPEPAEQPAPAPRAGPSPSPPSPRTPSGRWSPSASARPRIPPRRAVPLALVGLGVAALIGAAGVVGATQFGDSQQVVAARRRRRRRRHARLRAAEGRPAGRAVPDRARQDGLLLDGVGAPRDHALPRAGRRQAAQDHAQDGVGLAARARRRQPARRLARGAGVRAAQRGDRLDAARAREPRLRQLVAPRRPEQAHAARPPRRPHGAKAARSRSGAPQNPTPKGRFSVTDRLNVTGSQSPYGCCVLALTRPPDRPAALLARRRPPRRARHRTTSRASGSR